MLTHPQAARELVAAALVCFLLPPVLLNPAATATPETPTTSVAGGGVGNAWFLIEIAGHGDFTFGVGSGRPTGAAALAAFAMGQDGRGLDANIRPHSGYWSAHAQVHVPGGPDVRVDRSLPDLTVIHPLSIQLTGTIQEVRYLVGIIGGAVPDWRFSLEGDASLEVTQFIVGSEPPVFATSDDFDAAVNANAEAFLLGARATVLAHRALEAEGTLVGGFFRSNPIQGLDGVHMHETTLPDGSTETCPCFFRSLGAEAYGPGTYDFGYTGAAARVIFGEVLYLLVADVVIPGDRS